MILMAERRHCAEPGQSQTAGWRSGLLFVALYGSALVSHIEGTPSLPKNPARGAVGLWPGAFGLIPGFGGIIECPLPAVERLNLQPRCFKT